VTEAAALGARRGEGALVAFGAGLLFAAGLVVSGMADARKVLGFLDLAAWDPSLLCVMAGAVGVHFVAQRLARGRTAPLYAERFLVPTRRDIDRPLVLGAVLVGVGWGLSGYCPGPALVSLPLGGTNVLVFVLAMLLGMFVAAKVQGNS
jgi:uncharacterized membrane protein YedE/YeeE